MNSSTRKYNLGGVLKDRPFHIRRLGHVGLSAPIAKVLADFYVEELGFRVSDVEDLADNIPPEHLEELRAGGDREVYLLRHSSDHHTFFVTSENVIRYLARHPFNYEYVTGDTVNQISWQVGSLAEVADGTEFLAERGLKVVAGGRDMPGSNWHVYTRDCQRNINELFYGMEQVGWQGTSKPRAMYDRGFRVMPPLPQMCEQQEVDIALARGVDMMSGSRETERFAATYNVDGILLARPFKITRVGPIGLFSDDTAELTRSYIDNFGLRLTTSVNHRGRQIAYLRANTEHHCLAIVPVELASEVGRRATTRLAWMGFEVATYRQLRDAIAYLKNRGHEVGDVEPELRPGILYAASVRDPSGHLVLLYWGMAQIGSDGDEPATNPPERWRIADWPETIEDAPGHYLGEPFLGPFL